ncbi:UDP-2,3-diacylglucosamine diphosphatase [Prolixibacteraceae bacterium JC049]|nr:UDP-2,3-diacylglucosamine diphosphatase [Prolixibacteraceae bacterium JC049]
MGENKRTYFISDIHLGAPALNNNREREKLFVSWLDKAKQDAKAIYLVGDIFDFWFEYKKVVPRGFTRTLGKIAEITDSGIPVHFFTGNHDLWAFDYLPQEVGITIHREPVKVDIDGKTFFIAHGDGLDKSDKGYLLLKSIFTNKLLQWLFARVHPNLAFGIGHGWSKKSRLSHKPEEENFKGVNNEGMINFAREILKTDSIDIFVTGHRHVPMNIELEEGAKFVNTGDWVNHFTYAVFENGKIELKKYNSSSQSI